MIQDEEDDLAAEEENKLINEVSAPPVSSQRTGKSLLMGLAGIQDMVSPTVNAKRGDRPLNVSGLQEEKRAIPLRRRDNACPGLAESDLSMVP